MLSVCQLPWFETYSTEQEHKEKDTARDGTVEREAKTREEKKECKCREEISDARQTQTKEKERRVKT